VNHCVNDIAVRSEPAILLDYLGTASWSRARSLTSSKASRVRALKTTRLIGGENRARCGFYPAREYDVSGHCRVVEKSRMLTPEVGQGRTCHRHRLQRPHTKRLSLRREIFFEQLKLKPRATCLKLNNRIGDELSKSTSSYGPLVQKLIKRSTNRQSAIGKRQSAPRPHHRGVSWTTSRALPKNLDCSSQRRVECCPSSNLSRRRAACRTRNFTSFNHGIGCAIVAADEADAGFKIHPFAEAQLSSAM